MSPCSALLLALQAPAPGAAPQPDCAAGALELSAGFTRLWPEAGVSELFTLPRAQATLALAQDGVGARLVTAAVRSGGDDGYIGVAGEAIVLELRAAELRIERPTRGLGLAAGLVEDPWRASAVAAWGLPQIAPPLVEELGLAPPADLGLHLAYAEPSDHLRLGLAASAGEGLRQRERNDGQDTSALLGLRPLGDDRLQIEGLARAGSAGLGAARDHRAALRLRLEARPVSTFAEVERGWGLAGDAAATPLAASAGLRLALPDAPLGWARLDWSSAQPANPAADRTRLHLGLAQPFGPAQVGLAYTHTAADPQATALPGASSLAQTHQLLLFVSARLERPGDPA